MSGTTLLLATPISTLYERVDTQLHATRDILLLPAVRNDDEALASVNANHPDIVLLDHVAFAQRARMLIQRIHALHPATKGLLFAPQWPEHLVLAALQDGSSGCVVIDEPGSELVSAIAAVQRGEIWVPRRILAMAFRQLLAVRGDDTGDLQRLSFREREIVGWMRRGMSNKEIARKLGISDTTVKTHVHNIFHKLEVSGRVRLLRMRMPYDAAALASFASFDPPDAQPIRSA